MRALAAQVECVGQYGGKPVTADSQKVGLDEVSIRHPASVTQHPLSRMSRNRRTTAAGRWVRRIRVPCPSSLRKPGLK